MNSNDISSILRDLSDGQKVKTWRVSFPCMGCLGKGPLSTLDSEPKLLISPSPPPRWLHAITDRSKPCPQSASKRLEGLWVSNTVSDQLNDGTGVLHNGKKLLGAHCTSALWQWWKCVGLGQ